MSPNTALPFTESEVEDLQRQLLEENQCIAGFSNVNFSQFAEVSTPPYPYALTTEHSAGPSFTPTPTVSEYSDIYPPLSQYNRYNTAQPPLSIAASSSRGKRDIQPPVHVSAQPQSRREIDARGNVYFHYAGPSRSMAPPRIGRVASSSTSQDHGYRTDFRAPIPIPGYYSANGSYSFFPFGDQAVGAPTRYEAIEGTMYSSHNQEILLAPHPPRNGMPILGYRSPTQVPNHSSNPQMYPPSEAAQATVTAPDFHWDYSEPVEANQTVPEEVNVNYPSRSAPPPTPLSAETPNAAPSTWKFVNTFFSSPGHSISMKRRRSIVEDDQETAPHGELQDSFLRPVKRLRLEPSPLDVSASEYASGSGRDYAESSRFVPNFSTNSQVQHHLPRPGTGEAASNTSTTQRICLFDNCGATIHSPSAFESHLTSVHDLPRSKGRKDAPRYPCLWLGCVNKNGGRKEYAGNNIVRHATGHLVARRCDLCINEENVWPGCRTDLLKGHYLKKHEVRRTARELPPLFFI